MVAFTFWPSRLSRDTWLTKEMILNIHGCFAYYLKQTAMRFFFMFMCVTLHAYTVSFTHGLTGLIAMIKACVCGSHVKCRNAVVNVRREEIRVIRCDRRDHSSSLWTVVYNTHSWDATQALCLCPDLLSEFPQLNLSHALSFLFHELLHKRPTAINGHQIYTHTHLRLIVLCF